jgi:hypothetical protein
LKNVAQDAQVEIAAGQDTHHRFAAKLLAHLPGGGGRRSAGAFSEIVS